ncbi:MAG TPA: DUF4383 domain-containing protein [Micromonosporaceae bacterium]|nr:DUF4383 domain-containing protein [Micromonosporaceae bacterium]
MAHNPVNHPAQPIWRAISGLAGLYLVIFGVLGVIVTAKNDFFSQDDMSVLGQGSNLAHSVFSILIGLAVLAATGIGRNVDVALNKPLAYVFMALGLAGLALMQTSANFFNVTMPTVIVMMLVGLALLMAAMYGKVGSDDEHKAWKDGRLVL